MIMMMVVVNHDDMMMMRMPVVVMIDNHDMVSHRGDRREGDGGSQNDRSDNLLQHLSTTPLMGFTRAAATPGFSRPYYRNPDLNGV
jgi:hypothetical protein